MTSLLFDANALIYWACPSSPHHNDTCRLLRAAIAAKCSVYALSSSLNEVYYVLHRHYLDERDARQSIQDMAETFTLIDLTDYLVLTSIRSNEPDYEDGLIRAAAEDLQVDAIITYDKAAFKNSFIPKLTAAEAFAELFSGQTVPIKTK